MGFPVSSDTPRAGDLVDVTSIETGAVKRVPVSAFSAEATITALLAAKHNLAYTITAVAAAGTDASNAAALTAYTINEVSAANGTKGVLLPAAAAGAWVVVHNPHSSSAVKLWPATGDQIGTASVDATVSLAAGGVGHYAAVDGTTWVPL